MGKHYLATTGTSELWDKKNDLLLLGPWCLTADNKKIAGKDYTIIPSPWKPSCKLKEAEDYCYGAYEGLLPLLAEELNRIHGTSLSERYWRILTGPWLLYFTMVLYDRYKRIENAARLFPGLNTHALSTDRCDITSYNTYDFVAGKTGDDFYNLKLFSIVLDELIPDNVIRTSIQSDTGIVKPEYKLGMKYSIFNFVMKNLFSEGKVVMCNMYHLKNMDRLIMALRSGYGKVGFVDFFNVENTFTSSPEILKETRKSITLKGAVSRFEKLLYRIVPYAIPFSYVELFKQYRSYLAGQRWKNRPACIGSSVGWIFDELFKFFAAEAADKGARIIEFQHGGGYETFLSAPCERMALEKDQFYIWGKRSAEKDNVKHLPSPHLSRLKNTYKRKNGNILFIGVNESKYPFRFITNLQPEDKEKYFGDKKIFLRSLDAGAVRDLVYRPYDISDKDEIDAVRNEFSGIRILYEGFLTAHMRTARIVVIDHPHTSFIESLTINAPSILYWDQDVYLMREEAKDYFTLLEEAGILYKCPADAARKVNEIFNDPVSWWVSGKVQRARDLFCERYAHTVKDWMDEWLKEFNEIQEK